MRQSTLVIFWVLLSISGLSQNLAIEVDSSILLNCDTQLIDSTALKVKLKIKHQPILQSTEGAIKEINIATPINDKSKPWWLFLILVFSIIFIVVLRVYYSRDLYDMVRSLFNINLAQQYFREREHTISQSNIILNFLLILSISVYLSLIIAHINIKPLEWQTIFIISLVLVSTLSIIKFIYIEIASFVFPFSEIIRFYGFNLFINRRILAIGLMPFNLMVAYSEGVAGELFVYASIIFVGFMFLMGVLRGLIIGQKYFIAKKFHFFLYICTLEIAPLCVLIKWLYDYKV